MIRTARFAVVFAAAVALAGAAFGQSAAIKGPYWIKDLPIDEMSTVSFQDASTQGRAKAKLTAARRLIDRLTLQEDRAAARQPLVEEDVAAFAISYATQMQDKRNPVSGGYRLQTIIAQQFNQDRVRQYLEQHGVAYVDSQAGLAMIAPVALGGIKADDWGAQWAEPEVVNGQPTANVKPKNDPTVLTPYIASKETWTRRPTFMEVSAELGTTGANHAVVVEAYSQGGQFYVRIVDLRTGSDPEGTIAGPYASLAGAQAGAVAEMERAWKAQSIVRTSGSTNIALTASFRNLAEWVKIRKGLEGSRLVSGINIESLSQAGADVSFVYSGRPDQLAADLRSRGVSLSGTLLQVNAPQ